MSANALLKVLVATGNSGKARELAEILAEVPVRLTTLPEEGITIDVEETGATFEENALIKARAYCRMSGLPTLADDSGLEVDALNGEPGVRSKRYAGDDASDEQRVRYLLSKLEGVPEQQRAARFRSVIAIVLPSGWERVVDGTVEGYIARHPSGDNGFGYDPVFWVPGFGKTLAELPLSEKNSVSHRGRAARKATDVLRAMVEQGETA